MMFCGLKFIFPVVFPKNERHTHLEIFILDVQSTRLTFTTSGKTTRKILFPLVCVCGLCICSKLLTIVKLFFYKNYWKIFTYHLRIILFLCKNYL